MMTKEDFKQKVFDYTKSDFVFTGDNPCLVVFTTVMKGLSSAMHDSLKELAEEFAGQLDIFLVDVGQQTELRYVLHIEEVPILMYVGPHTPPKISVGNLTKSTLKNGLDALLKGNG